MKVVFAPGALTDIVEANRWRREHRREAPDVHRHVYFHVNADDDVVVLAVWGAVRRVLPALRERARSVR